MPVFVRKDILAVRVLCAAAQITNIDVKGAPDRKLTELMSALRNYLVTLQMESPAP